MGKLYGYARVSTHLQNIDMQVSDLVRVGIERDDIFIDDGISGAKASRPAFDKLLSIVQEGDTIVAWKLDRLGRTVVNLSQLANDLKAKGVYIRTIMDGIDTSTKMGSLLYNLLSTLAEMERDAIMERIEAGKANARKNDVLFGRKILLKKQHVDDAREKLKTMTVKQVADFLKVSEPTLYRALNRYPAG